MSFVNWLKSNKLAAGLGVLCVLFGIATIVLAAELSKSLDDDDAGSNNGTETPPPDSSSTLPTPTEPWETDLRIPKELMPLDYQVTLRPDMAKGVFTGSVAVSFTLSAARSWIPIHVKELNMTQEDISMTDGSSKTIPIERIVFYKPNEFLVLFFGDEIGAGTYILSISYSGSLQGKIVGFYESVYLDDSGNSRTIATSKFEPVDARAAFPCFDEPALKAKFTVNLVRPKNDYSALSNMNEESRVDGPGPNEVTVKFATSVKMSTYLVCFIVSDFVSSGQVTVNNSGVSLPVQVFATAQQKDNTLYARDIAQQVTSYYLKYFNIPYPLPKLDLIAIPDFVSGAMEHWGLITFRETALLFDNNTNSASAQKRVASVVAHEIAHQWFGNLVTMAWWDDLWLNEGFASFMESKALAEGVEDCASWKMKEQNIYDDMHPVLSTDAALNSHPIVQTVSNPDQINQLFDSISYDKGQAVLHMLEDFLTPNVFQKGLQSYLTANSLSNAKTEDLWKHLNEAYNNPEVSVSDVMNTWTKQMGYPFVQVKRQANKITLSQERYLTDKDLSYDFNESPFAYKWDIPIKFVTSADPAKPSEVQWLRRDVSELALNVASDVKFIKVNYNQTGFYRVNYETSEWKVLAANIMQLAALDRAHLLNDVFNLASSGYTDYANALDMLKYLSAEKEYLPWASGLDAANILDLLLAETAAYPQYRKFVQSLIAGLYGDGNGQYNWTVPAGDGHLNRLLRAKVLSNACHYGHSQCTKDVGALFTSWLNDQTTPIAPDLRATVYVYGMSAVGNEEVWDKTWSLYLKETNAQEKINLLQALAYAQEPWLIQKFLTLAWDEQNVRSQDYFNVLGYIAGTPIGSPVVWDYFRSHWEDMVKRFGLQHRYFGSSILSITKLFTSQTRLDELQAFFAKYPDAGAGEASRKNAEERISTRVLWTIKHADTINKWLQSQST